MPIQPHRTKSYRAVKVKTPGGKVVTHYRKRNPPTAKCGKCKKPLQGLPRLRAIVLKRTPKSYKTVTRKYGGNLCSKCSRKSILESTPGIKKAPLVVGQLCIKLAGRDSGKIGVIVEQIDDNFVIVDGQTRRKRCNVTHLETLDKKIDIKAKATHDVIKKELEQLGIKVVESKPKEKKKQETTSKSKAPKKETKKTSKK